MRRWAWWLQGGGGAGGGSNCGGRGRPNFRLATINKIKGVKIGDTRHRITQFADDTALIQVPGDDKETNVCTAIWQEATSMSENTLKREGLLSASLNRDRHRAPEGIIDKDAWLEDGKSVRALGVPLGNNIDRDAWYVLTAIRQ